MTHRISVNAWAPRSSAPGPSTNRIGLAAVAGVLVLFFALRHETFLTGANATAIGVNISAVAIAGIGSAILLISGHVDLSIGGMFGLVCMIVGDVAANASNPVVPVVAGLLAGLALGSVNGGLVHLLRISPIMVTIGLLAVYRGFAYVVSADYVYGFESSFLEIGRGEVAGLRYPIIAAVVVLVIVGFGLTRTALGLHLYAVGGDRRAAERAGIRVDRLVFGAYAFNGLLIGAIAVLTTAQLGSGTPTLGANFEFDVLTAVILGGVAFAGGAGRPLGLVIGVVTIGIIDSGLIFEGLQDWWQQIAKGGFLLLALGADQVRVARQRRKAELVQGSQSPGIDDPTATEFEFDSVVGRDRAPAHPERTERVEAVLEVCGVSKNFGAIRALEETHLTLHRGEVIALLGDNGAGKSTLVKIIAGALRPDRGGLRIAGEPVQFRAPADARAAGIETVYQDLALCPNLSVVHNLVLGSEPKRRLLKFVRVRDERRAREIATRRLGELGIRLQDPSALVEFLSGGQRQAVAVARALDEHVRVVCLDEPTAALGVAQTEHVLELVRLIASRGTSVILITHDVSSVLKASDRVVVLRRGSVVYDDATSNLTELELLQLMAGLDSSTGGLTGVGASG